MYHKATACNVIPDIVEVVNLLQTILSCCNTNADGKIFISYSPLFSFACWPMYKNFRNRTPSQGRIQKIFWTKVWVYYLRYPIFMAGNNGELKMLWFSAKTFYVRPCFLQRFKFREFSLFFLRIFAWIYFHQASIIIDDSFFTKRTSSHSNVESQSSTKSVRAGRRWDCFKIFFLLFLLKKNKNTVPLKALQDWKDRSDVTMRALSLLNSFVPTEIHKACLGKFLV